MRCTRGERRLWRVAVLRVFDFAEDFDELVFECVVEDLWVVVVLLAGEPEDWEAACDWVGDESGVVCRRAASTGWDEPAPATTARASKNARDR